MQDFTKIVFKNVWHTSIYWAIKVSVGLMICINILLKNQSLYIYISMAFNFWYQSE